MGFVFYEWLTLVRKKKTVKPSLSINVRKSRSKLPKKEEKVGTYENFLYEYGLQAFLVAH